MGNDKKIHQPSRYLGQAREPFEIKRGPDAAIQTEKQHRDTSLAQQCGCAVLVPKYFLSKSYLLFLTALII
jgi:hypothetical protein